MKHIKSTLVVAGDELSRIGLLGILAGSRYRPIAAKEEWEVIVASGKPLPEVVILILSGTMTDPDEVVGRIEPIAKRSKVVVLAAYCEAKLVRSATCAGAVAFLPRSVSSSVLVHTLDLVFEGNIILPASVARAALACEQLKSERNAAGCPDTLTTSERVGRLSSREIEILRRLVHGDSNKQISRQLQISEPTVKVHIKAILRKIRVSNRTQAAIWGIDYLTNLADAATASLNPSHSFNSGEPLTSKRESPVAGDKRRNGSVVQSSRS